MRQALYIILSLLLLCQSVFGQEYRGGVSAEFQISPKLQAEAGIELRKIFYPGSYFNRTFQGSLDYKFSGAWSFGALYSFSLISEKDEMDDELEGVESSDRNKIALDINYQSHRFDNALRLSNRFRFQYAVTGDEGEPRAYLRNKITLDYKISGMMNPYVALEPYYRLGSNKISNLRIYLGNEMPLFKTKVELYYIAEIRVREDLTTAQYIIGLAIELDFKR